MKAQNQPEEIAALTKRVDSVLLSLSKDPVIVFMSNQDSERKIKLYGTFDHNSKFFKQIIRYGDGIKKEVLIIDFNGPTDQKFILKVVLINDAYFYIKYNTYDSRISSQKISTEILADGRIYHKINFDKHSNVLNMFSVWNAKSK